MKLSAVNRLKICWEVLTTSSGHGHTAQEKQLSTFIRGYDAGRKDEKSEQLGRHNDSLLGIELM